MKTAISAGVGLALAASATFVAPQQAEARGNDEARVCQFLVAAQIYSSVGECVSFFRTRPVVSCDDPNVQQAVGAKNKGQCVALFRSLG